MNDDVDPFRDWDSAYILGMLSPEDRRTFERHLSGCLPCTSAVAELTGLPGILSALTTSEATALESAPNDEHLRGEHHQPDLVQKLASSANRRRRRDRAGMVGLILGVAAVVAVGGIFVGTSITPATNLANPATTNDQSGTALAMTPVKPGVMTANLQVTTKPWGTRFDWNCDYLNADWTTSNGAPTYALVITDAGGNQTTVATWAAAGPGADGLVAITSLLTTDIKSVEIRTLGSITPLVRTEL